MDRRLRAETRWGLVAIALAVSVLVGPLSLPASAQRLRAPYRVGVLNDARATNHPTVDGLKAGLKDHGLEEGREVVFDIRATDGNPERILRVADALVKAGVDVIFTSGGAATFAAKAATRSIPIVFNLVGDPIASGIVKSLPRPEGNVTGVSSLATELLSKRLETLKALAPGVRRVWAIHLGADQPPGGAMVQAASPFGLEVVASPIRTQDDLARLLESLRLGDALLVPDAGALDISAVLLETSLARRIPAMFSSDLWVSHGGLVSYGADYRAQGLQAARLVAKVLRGAHPRELPVEGADRVVLAVNLKTAASFGLTAPRQILYWADSIRR